MSDPEPSLGEVLRRRDPPFGEAGARLRGREIRDADGRWIDG